jgi:hypothetical protein
MESQDPKKDKNDSRSSKLPAQAKKRLEKFLASLCEAKGLGKPKPPAGTPSRRMACKCPCSDAEWRAQLDIQDGVICVYSKVTRQEADGPHRDVTLAVTYLDEDGREDYADITFCDGELRWIMEALWHAPIWD